jgi:hypothetical protein
MDEVGPVELPLLAEPAGGGQAEAELRARPSTSRPSVMATPLISGA